MAAAGPAVTLACSRCASPPGAVLASGGTWSRVAPTRAGFTTTPGGFGWAGSASLNALVLLFNLIPAFPLDGGQIVHALLVAPGDRNRATRGAGRVGQAFGCCSARSVCVLAKLRLLSGRSTMVLGLFVYQSAAAAVLQGTINQRIQQLRVADVMDPEPVTIPAERGCSTLRSTSSRATGGRGSRWWTPPATSSGWCAERVDAEIAAGRPALSVSDVLEENLPIRIDEDPSLESVLRSEALGRLGAMVAVDADGVLQGVVTVAQIRQALRPATAV